MAQRFSTAKSAALVGGLAVVLGVGVGPAFAQDDGYENVFTSVLSAVGLMTPDKAPEIEYRERPPLVVPPKQALVKPQEPGAGRTAAWPQDPDVISRRKVDADARAPQGATTGRDGVERLSKDELLKYRAAQTPVTDPYACNMNEKNLSKCRVSPDELKAESDRFRKENPEKSDTLEAGVEPPRDYLTQPPKGYMKTTKTIVATHEAPEKRGDAQKSIFLQPAGGKIDPLDH